MIVPILFAIAAVVVIAVAWGNALHRTLPGMPVIGAEVSVPRATASSQRRHRRRLERERRAHNPNLRRSL